MAGPLWVAVGSAGERVWSEDGERWQEAAPVAGDVGLLRSVAYGDGRFVAVGGTPGKGAILESANGKVWRVAPSPQRRVDAVVFGAGQFVAAAGWQLIWSKSPGVFTLGEDLPGDARVFGGAAGDTEAGFRFAFIGEATPVSGDLTPWRGVTSDGTRWEHSSSRERAVDGIAYGAGVFVVVGAGGLVEVSHDGENWEKQPFPEPDDLLSIVWSGSEFLAAGERLWGSPDGRAWRRIGLTAPARFAWAGEKLAFGFDFSGRLIRSLDRRLMVPTALPVRLEAIAFRPGAE